MNAITLFITVLILLPAAALVAWVWFDMTRFDADLQTLGTFEANHFAIGPQATDRSTCAIPG